MPKRQPLDVPEVATYLGVKESYVRHLVHERRIPFYKVGRLVRFDPDELDVWFKSGRQAPRDEAPIDLNPYRRR